MSLDNTTLIPTRVPDFNFAAAPEPQARKLLFAAMWRDPVLLLAGLVVGIGFSWVISRMDAEYTGYVDSAALEVRLEVAQNHPDLLAHVLPFIECAVEKQKSSKNRYAHFKYDNFLMASFRSEVAICAKEADNLLQKTATDQTGNLRASNLALPPAVELPVMPLRELNLGPVISLPERSDPARGLRPPQIAQPSSVTYSVEQASKVVENYELAGVFTPQPISSVMNIIEPQGKFGSLIPAEGVQFATELLNLQGNQ